MDYFQHVMVLVSIVIGLAITHMLSGVGTAIHRLRGHGEPIKFEGVYLFWVGYLFLWVIGFWWWEFKFSRIDTAWTLSLYLLIVGYAIVLYLSAVVLVPSGMEGVDDSYAYFLSVRSWFIPLLVLGSLIDIFDTWAKGSDWVLRPSYVGLFIVTLACYGVAAFANNRRVQLWNAVIVFLLQAGYFFQEMAALGSF